MNETSDYFFICNPASNSGRMKKQWPGIEEVINQHFPDQPLNYQFTEYPGHAVEIVQDVLDNGYHNIVTIGGDGTTNEVLNGLMKLDKSKDVNIGILPSGTSNDSCLTHNLGKTVHEAIKHVVDPKIKTFPVGKISGDFGEEPYYFLDHADTGLGAMSAQSALNGSRLLKGEFKYTVYAMKHIIGFKGNPGTVTVDETSYDGKFAVAAIGLGETMGGYQLWPGNSPLNSEFGIILVRDIKKFKLLRVMLSAEKGHHISKPEVDYIHGKTIKIDLDKPWPFQAEGEIFTGSSTSISMEYIPDQVNLMTNVQ